VSGPKDRAGVLEAVEERNLTFSRLWFADVPGFLKSFAITVDELEAMGIEEGCEPGEPVEEDTIGVGATGWFAAKSRRKDDTAA